MKVVIIGGVAGGASAATRLRRLDEKAEIVVLSAPALSPMPIAACPTILAASSRMRLP